MIVKEHLGNEEITTAIHFGLQVAEVCGAAGTFHMPLRVAGSPYAEIAAGFYFLHELVSIFIITSLRECHTIRDIAAQGQHILNSLCPELLN